VLGAACAGTRTARLANRARLPMPVPLTPLCRGNDNRIPLLLISMIIEGIAIDKRYAGYLVAAGYVARLLPPRSNPRRSRVLSLPVIIAQIVRAGLELGRPDYLEYANRMRRTLSCTTIPHIEQTLGVTTRELGPLLDRKLLHCGNPCGSADGRHCDACAGYIVALLLEGVDRTDDPVLANMRMKLLGTVIPLGLSALLNDDAAWVGVPPQAAHRFWRKADLEGGRDTFD
jgi:hypothetical protein